MESDPFKPLYASKDIPKYEELDYFKVIKSQDFDYIYRPGNDSIHLLDTLRLDIQVILEAKPVVGLEIGSGSGFIINSFGHWLQRKETKLDIHLLATDLNYDANEFTKRVADHFQVGVDVFRTDIASGFTQRLRGKVDLIICNPPYVPTDTEELEDAMKNLKLQSQCFIKGELDARRKKANLIGLSYAGGAKGLEVLLRMIDEAKDLLSVGGLFYLLLIEENDPKGTIQTKFGDDYKIQLILKERYQNELTYTFRIKKIA